MATAYSTKGLAAYLEKGGSTRVALIPTAISKAAPAVVTVTNTLANGDPVYCSNTGFSELDGKWFVASNASGTKFDLLGSDTTDSADTLDAAPTAEAVTTANMVLLCVASAVPSATVPANISVGTFCDPSASLPAQATDAGTVTLTGFVDVGDDGYKELLLAKEDGVSRVFEVIFPQNQGYLICPVIISSVVWDLPLSGGIGWTITGALGTSAAHRF
jgi:hypothetical protein